MKKYFYKCISDQKLKNKSFNSYRAKIQVNQDMKRKKKI